MPTAADLPPHSCALCAEPLAPSETAVAVRQANGLPGLVHPACYPKYSAQQKQLGNADVARSPLRDVLPPSEQRADGSV